MGIIKAAVNAADSMMEDAWLEFFYCDAIPNGTLLVRGKKRVSANSANRDTPDNVISKGSKIVVNEGQAALVVCNGKVTAVYDTPGDHTFKEGKALLAEFKQRVAFGGDNVATQHRLYYVNLHESLDHPFIVHVPVTIRNSGACSTITFVLKGNYSYSITDPEKFYRSVTGNISGSFSHGQISRILDSEFQEALIKVVAKLGNNSLDITSLTAHTQQLCAAVREQMQQGWAAQHGLGITSLLLPSVYPEGHGMQRTQKREDLTWISGKSARSDPPPSPVRTVPLPAQPAPPIAEPEAGASWRCSCGNVSTSKFCTECGKARPDEWTCSCGSVGRGKFCEACGKPRPAAWTCTCGSVCYGKFCESCGKPREM